MNKRLIKLCHRVLILSGIIALAGCNMLPTKPSAFDDQRPSQSQTLSFHKAVNKPDTQLKQPYTQPIIRA